MTEEDPTGPDDVPGSCEHSWPERMTAQDWHARQSERWRQASGEAVPTNAELARDLVASLPSCDSNEPDAEMVSLCDLVVTGLEVPWTHVRIRKYDPRGDGSAEHPWAIVEPLPSGLREGQKRRPIAFTNEVVRKAAEAYCLDHLNRGTTYDDVKELLIGTYCDADVCDAIVQFAVYGEVVFS